MTDNHRTDLVYGHLGEPRYLSEQKKWEFTRVPDHGRRLKQIGSSKITVSGNLDNQHTSNVHLAESRIKNINLLRAHDPFLAPAIPFLPPLAQVSEHVNHAAAAYDPCIGNLLAFGKAKYEEPHPGTKFVDIAATVTGPRGENVQFIRLTKDRARNSSLGDAVIEVSTLEGGEGSLWIGPGSPIQQLCFSQGTERSSSLLAVRTLLGVAILRPIIRHNLVPIPFSNGSAQRSQSKSASRLDPNLIITISIQDAAKVPFLDVAFNPWLDEQFGVVDEHGQWGICELNREQKIKDLFCNNTFGHDSPNERRKITSGWGKITWAADVNTIVVVHRHDLNVCHVQSRKRLAEPTIRKAISNDKILDVTRDPRDFSMLYILTSTKILWVQVQVASDDSTEQYSNVTILLSCWHYRSFHDPSLRLCVAEREKSTLILVWSQLASLITVSTFGLSSDSGAHQSCLDAYELVTDLCSKALGPEHTPRYTRTKALHLHAARTLSGTVVDLFSFEPLIEIFQLSALHHNYSISEGLYQDLPSQEQPVQLVNYVRRGQANLMSSTSVQDQFIIPDALCSEDEGFVSASKPRKWVEEPLKEPELVTSEDPFTFSNEWLAKFLNHRIAEASTGPSSRTFESQDHLMYHLRQFTAENEGVLEFGVKLLGEAFEAQATVSDLDGFSQLLHRIFQDTTGTRFLNDGIGDSLEDLFLRSVTLAVPSLSSFMLRNDHQADDTTLVNIYSSLVRRWVSSLPSRTPPRIRVNLNRTLRVVALQLYFSLHGIVSSASELQQEPELPFVGKDMEFPALAVRRKTLLTPDPGQAIESVQRAQEMDQWVPMDLRPALLETSLPTPAPSSTASSQRSMSQDATIADDAFTRLRALATLRFQPALRDTAKQLLSHWEVGTDPSIYDWAAKKESFERAERDAEMANDPEALRQKRRREKRMKRQLDSSQKVVASSSQQQPMLLPMVRTPAAMVGSDPVSRPNFGDSSQHTQGMMLFTQEEPGRFGGRLEKKKKATKPARREGF